MAEETRQENAVRSGDDVTCPNSVIMCAAFRIPRWSSAHGLCFGWLLHLAVT